MTLPKTTTQNTNTKINRFSYALQILNMKLSLLSTEGSPVSLPSGKSFSDHPCADALRQRIKLQLEGKPYKHIPYTGRMAGLNELLYVYAKPIVDMRDQ